MDSDDLRLWIIGATLFGIYVVTVYQGARRNQKVQEKAMNTEYIVTGVIALLLLGYLIFALLKPEKF
jgi:K+-transporting ATPase KdpF subunit